MIAAWLAYAVVIGALLSVAALIVEGIATLRRWPRRWIWVAALSSSLLLPVLLAWIGTRPAASPSAQLATLVAQGVPPIYQQSPVEWVGGDAAVLSRGIDLDSWLLAAWVLMSSLVLATLTMGWRQLRRRLRCAVDREIAGIRVSVTLDVGPAVVGIRRPRIVIPRWLLEQDAATQTLVIAHEHEHLRSQDIRVLGAALLLAALFPWNLPLWWQLRRLRFAMEVDCDARVLGAGQSHSDYSAVLLNVATRLVPLRAAATGLSESGSALEKRIRIMHTPLRERWRLLAFFLGACSFALVAIAANVAPPPVPARGLDYAGELPLLPTPVEAWKDEDAALARAVGHFFPQLLTTQQQGRLYVWAVVNQRGEVSQIDMDVRPAWDSEAEFARKWQEYRQQAGVIESLVRQQFVQQIFIGPNYSVLAWVMQSGAVALDATAPAFEIAGRQAKTAEARMLATVDSQRRVLERFDSAAISEGVPAGQEVWLLLDADGRALKAGRRAVITDPQSARLAMQKMFPDMSVGYVTRGTVVKDAAGRRIPVSWQWLER